MRVWGGIFGNRGAEGRFTEGSSFMCSSDDTDEFFQATVITVCFLREQVSTKYWIWKQSVQVSPFPFRSLRSIDTEREETAETARLLHT